LAAIYENGKQQSAESPGLKLKKTPVALAEFTNAFFGIDIVVGSEVVPEVLKEIFSESSTQFRINSPKLRSFSLPVLAKLLANILTASIVY
jgi:hypothetical protein